jgi:hypothetical protein
LVASAEFIRQVKNSDPKDPISGFQVSGVRCQERKTKN